MKEIKVVIEEHLARERGMRNEELRARLREGRSFEELLAELAALKGFNVEEREEASRAYGLRGAFTQAATDGEAVA